MEDLGSNISCTSSKNNFETKCKDAKVEMKVIQKEGVVKELPNNVCSLPENNPIVSAILSNPFDVKREKNNCKIYDSDDVSENSVQKESNKVETESEIEQDALDINFDDETEKSVILDFVKRLQKIAKKQNKKIKKLRNKLKYYVSYLLYLHNSSGLFCSLC